METAVRIRHSATDRYLGSGGTWVGRGHALAMTPLQAQAWMAQACEPQALETVGADATSAAGDAAAA